MECQHSCVDATPLWIPALDWTDATPAFAIKTVEAGLQWHKDDIREPIRMVGVSYYNI